MNWYKMAETEKKLILMRGVSGAGKSSLAKELGKNGVIYSTDDFFNQTGEYLFDAKKLGQAHQWNQKRTEEAMQQEMPLIVVDNTNTRLQHMAPYILLAQKFGYKIQYAEPAWDNSLKDQNGKWNVDFIKKLQQDRLKKDPSKIIPNHVVEKMIDNYEYSIAGESDENFTKRILDQK